ncbi:hypothetical protein Kisp01_46650 [Kineosporia sp. NBRC 101677]|nr:hypothetical protein Kisp01_46650 [Kineosporia sp. NBRC 101677]
MPGVRPPSGISREALACMIEPTPYMTAATRAEPSPSSTHPSSQVLLSRAQGPTHKDEGPPGGTPGGPSFGSGDQAASTGSACGLAVFPVSVRYTLLTR